MGDANDRENIASALADHDDLYELYSSLNFYKALASAAHSEWSGRGTGAVVQLISHFSNLALIGLEDELDIKSAFCGSALDVQLDYILDASIPRYGKTSDDVLSVANSAITQMISSGHMDSILDSGVKGHDGILCNRSASWAEEISQVKEPGHIFAVGLFHLFDYRPGTEDECPGLLTLLRKRGVEAELVK